MNALSKNKTIDARITSLRAFAILAVVFGHSIILYSDSWGLYQSVHDVPVFNTIKQIINLFQMPLFFSISGFLFSRRAICNLKQLCLKKAIRLLIPYFSIALLWMIPIRLMVGYRGYAGRTVFDILIRCILLGEDNGHLWFLPCLYLCFLFSAAALRFFERVRLNTARSPALLLIASVVVFSAQSLFLRIPFSSFLVNFSRYWIWFCLGFAFHETQWLHKLSKDKALFFLLSVISAALSIRVSSHLNLFAQLAILIFAYAAVPNRSSPILDFISRNSFGLYLFHSPLIYITFSQIPNANPFIVLVINFFLFGGTAILLTLLIRKTRLRILIGE